MPPYARRLSRKERKLERKRQEIERKRSSFLEYLHREIKYGNINRKRYDKRWKEMLTKLALERSRSDLENTWQACDWALDLKDFIISAHMDELQKANDQSVSALENHNARIDMFIIQYKNTLNSIHLSYLEELENLKEYNRIQDENYMNAADEQHIVIGSMLFHIERSGVKYIREQLAENFMSIESRTNDDIIATNQLENDFDIKIGKLWAKCNETFNEYSDATKRKMHKYQIFRDAHEVSSAANDRNLKRIVHLIYCQKILQEKLDWLCNNDGQKLENMTDRLEKVRRILSSLVTKISADIKLDDIHIKLLVSCSIKTLDYLNRILRKGELVLKLMGCSKKYETLHEKVLPYPAGKITKYTGNLGLKLFMFHIRIANIDASRSALNEERKVLQIENSLLLKKLEKLYGYKNCSNKNRTFVNQQRTHDNSFYSCRLQTKNMKS